jgi:Protein of unknown function (DUF1569)
MVRMWIVFKCTLKPAKILEKLKNMMPLASSSCKHDRGFIKPTKLFKLKLKNMKSIYDNTTRAEIISRIDALNDTNTAQWGKMNLYQMLKHCKQWEEMVQGKKTVKRMFLGRLIGKMALKSVLKDETPLGRNSPTSPELVVMDNNGDMEIEKKKWMSLIEDYAHFSNHDFIHPFFGKMTTEQIGYFVYKHIDHHLRQFKG